MRNLNCPICHGATKTALRLQFGEKMKLPREIDLQYCPKDNFLFVGNNSQIDYDQYYANFSNDTFHQEVSLGDAHSPISKLQNDHLIAALDGFLASPKKVLDFGCGEASLLVELAANCPSSSFFGFEPGPAARTAREKIRLFGLNNLSIVELNETGDRASYDLIIASHVVEHVIDFDLLAYISGLLKDDALFYVEVPDALQYEKNERREFLYYFDRLHVNHFTPQSLVRLLAKYGFSYVKHFQYYFPYRDGGEYPALGMLFMKGDDKIDIVSASLMDVVNRYIKKEKERASVIADLLGSFDGVLIWGVGDNFFRALKHRGPLSKVRQMILLDRRSQQVLLGNQTYQTMDPETGVRSHRLPVVVTISEGRQMVGRQIADIDPERRVIFI